MDAITVQCPTCRGLGVIGTSVGSNQSRGSTYDCDTCHGTGSLKLFAGVAPDATAAISAEARAEALREAADRGWQALKKTGCPLGITYSAFYEEVTGEKYNPLG